MTAEHECRQGKRCRARKRDPNNTWRPAMIEHQGLCRPCEDATFDAIRDLGADRAQLDAAITVDCRKQQTAKVGGTRDMPTPLNLAAEALAAAIDTEWTRWGRAVTRPDDPDCDLPYRWYMRITTRLGTLVDLPTRRYWDMLPLPFGGDHLAQLEADGVDGALRLAELHHQAGKVTGRTETRIWLPDPCHVCGMKTLSPSAGQDLITCRSCRNVWDAHQFAKLQDQFDYDKREIRT